MRLDSVREIKQHFLQATEAFAVGVNTPQRKVPGSIGMGVTKVNGLYCPAVRCYSGGPRTKKLQEIFVELILGKTKNEADVQWVNMPSAIDPVVEMMDEKAFNQRRVRPIRVGFSVGHKNITAGSIGVGTEKKNAKGLFILSNAHVLNDCNKGRKGDECLQPGKYDGGALHTDVVATVFESIKLKSNGNKVDAAIALLNKDVEFDYSDIEGLGKWNGFADHELSVGDRVKKLGRTTQATYGKITAVEMDQVRVQYGSDLGVLSFNNQIEMVADSGKGGGPDKSSYLLGGDSGSCTIDEDNRGIGLNFAGNTQQAYANDMREVVKALKLKSIQ